MTSGKGPALIRSQTGAHEELLGRVKTCSGFSLVREVRMGEASLALQEPRGNPKSSFLPCLSIQALSVLVRMPSSQPAPAPSIHWVGWMPPRPF